MIFDLARDFTDALAAMPRKHPKHRTLELFEEAIRRDIHFIDRHPTTLFQCMWNLCWWYDCPGVLGHYVLNGGAEFRNAGSASDDDPLTYLRKHRLSHRLLSWRRQKRELKVNVPWVRALRPPVHHLASPLKTEMFFEATEESHLAYSSDGRLLVAVSELICVWDAGSGARLWLESLPAKACALATSPVATMAAVGLSDGTVVTVSFTPFQFGPIWKAHASSVTALSFTLDGERLVSASHDCTISVWEVPDFSETLSLNYHHYPIVALTFVSQTASFISIDQGGVVHRYDLANRCLLWKAEGSPNVALTMDISCDGSTLALAGPPVVYLVDTTTREQKGRFEVHWGEVNRLRFSPNGTSLATCVGGPRSDTLIGMWNPERVEELGFVSSHSIDGHLSASDIAFSPDGRYLASVGRDSRVRIWNVQCMNLTPYALVNHSSRIKGVCIAPKGTRAVTVGEVDETVMVWDMATGLCLSTYRYANADDKYSPPLILWHPLFSPDGDKLFLARGFGSVDVFDFAGDRLVYNMNMSRSIQFEDLESLGSSQRHSQASNHRWQAFSREHETVFYMHGIEEPVARFSVPLQSCSSDEELSRVEQLSVWVGASGQNLYLLQLELGMEDDGLVEKHF